MIHQLSYNDRQEWIVRVGCLFIVVGVHLWLLLFSENNYAISGSNKSEASLGPLALSFSTSQPDQRKAVYEPKIKEIVKPKNVKQVKTEPVHKAKPKIAKKIIPEDNKIKKDEIKEVVVENNKPNIDNTKMKELDVAMVNSEPVNNQAAALSKTIVYKPELAEPPVPPTYPRKARRKKQQGTVWLDVLLDESGEQKKLNIYKSSGFAILDKAAVRAVEQWRFAKFQSGYAARDVKIRIPIEFLLN